MDLILSEDMMVWIKWSADMRCEGVKCQTCEGNRVWSQVVWICKSGVCGCGDSRM